MEGLDPELRTRAVQAFSKIHSAITATFYHEAEACSLMKDLTLTQLTKLQQKAYYRLCQLEKSLKNNRSIPDKADKFQQQIWRLNPLEVSLRKSRGQAKLLSGDLPAAATNRTLGQMQAKVIGSMTAGLSMD